MATPWLAWSVPIKLYGAEATSDGGTTVRVSIADIGATGDVGQQIKLTFGSTCQGLRPRNDRWVSLRGPKARGNP